MRIRKNLSDRESTLGPKSTSKRITNLKGYKGHGRVSPLEESDINPEPTSGGFPYTFGNIVFK